MQTSKKPWGRVLPVKLKIARQETGILWQRKVTYREHNSPTMAHILSHSNVVHVLLSYFLDINIHLKQTFGGTRL
jgi:hypothetical protein